MKNKFTNTFLAFASVLLILSPNAGTTWNPAASTANLCSGRLPSGLSLSWTLRTMGQPPNTVYRLEIHNTFNDSEPRGLSERPSPVSCTTNASQIRPIHIVYAKTQPPLPLMLLLSAVVPRLLPQPRKLRVLGAIQLAPSSQLQTAAPNLQRLLASDIILTSAGVHGLVKLSELILLRAKIARGDDLPPLLRNLTSLVSAKLSDSRLGRIRRGDFGPGLTVLRYLYLSRCNITALDPGAFAHLPQLRMLFLTGNPRLSLLPDSSAFAGLSRLEHLSLRDNGLTRLAPDGAVFAWAATSLRQLDLSGNRLTGLPDNAFRGLLQLRTLELAGNPLLRLTPLGSATGFPGCPRVLCPLEALVTLRLTGSQPEDAAAATGACQAVRSLQRVLFEFGQPLDCQRGSRGGRTDDAKPDHDVELCRCNVGDERRWWRRRGQPLDKRDSQQAKLAQGDHRPSMTLIAIFGAICGLHLVVMLLMLGLCWRIGHRRASSRSSPTPPLLVDAMGADADEIRDIVGGGDCGESTGDAAAAVLISFRARTTGHAAAAAAAASMEADGADERLCNDFDDGIFPREKMHYEFNEDV